MESHVYVLAAVAQPPSGAFLQLAALFVLMLGDILFSIIGIVDGLVFRRVRFRYGIVVLTTFRGLPAQLIGVGSIFTALFGLYLAGLYITMLGRYCQGNAGCFVITPITGLVANWATVIGLVIILFCFIDWVRKRRAEVAEPTADTTTPSYSLPNVYRYVNDKFALAGLPRMNRLEVEQIMEFVEQHAPFVVLSGTKQVMDGKGLDHTKLAAVFLTDERFRNKGQRERIALEAVTEAYVATRQPH